MAELLTRYHSSPPTKERRKKDRYGRTHETKDKRKERVRCGGKNVPSTKPTKVVDTG
jgi:hypothetical protein